jgi:hypothetical protein
MRRCTKIILAVIGVAIVWPFAQIGLIAAQAQYFANGRPYCIEVSDDRFMYYRPVGSLLKLNGFTLRAPFFNGGGSGSTGSLQWTFHALLGVDTGGAPEWRNWSYWHQHFDQLTPQQAKATHLYRVDCQPQADFVFKLPFIATYSLSIRSPDERSGIRD